MRLQRYYFFLNYQTFLRFFSKKTCILPILRQKMHVSLRFQRFICLFWRILAIFLVHPVTIVFIAIFAKNFQFSIQMYDSNSRMRDAIEGICLHSCIMQHIFKDDVLTDLQFMVKFPFYIYVFLREPSFGHPSPKSRHFLWLASKAFPNSRAYGK